MCKGPARLRTSVKEALATDDGADANTKPVVYSKDILGRDQVFLPDPAPFSVSDVRNSIPKHCFERSFLKSSLYLIANLVIVGFLWLVADKYVGMSSLPKWAPLVFWPLWWYLQGVFMTGLWVIGHECGHQSYSTSQVANDTVGLIVHSCLLVPYHAWKRSHSLHHGNCCSMEQDTVFLPATRTQTKNDKFTQTMLGFAPLRLVYIVVFFLILGWPLHLLIHATGARHGKSGWINHFNPYCDLFTPRQAAGVMISDIALASVCYGLYNLTQAWGFDYMLKMYFIPYLLTNCWLVTITNLQHTDTHVPHYRGKAWNWLRGALATVDRDFGWFHNIAMHHIVDSHVAHHLFHTMPHYKAIVATKALKEFLGPYYKHDDTPVVKALWRSWTNCRFVEDEGGVLFYKKEL